MLPNLRFVPMAFAALALIGCEAPATVNDVVASPSPDVTPAPAVLRRLSESQYTNAVHDLFGDDLFVPTHIEPEVRLDGLAALGSSEVSISPRGVERFEAAAYTIAEQAMAAERRADLVPCTPAAVTDETCARTYLGSLARRAWRRPVEAVELDTLVDIATQSASTLGDFHEGLVFGIATVLQAPDFLMRPELGADGPDGRVYTDHEMAARIAFLLWNTLPDDELLDAADAGELSHEAGLDVQIERMLADPRARQGGRAYTDDLLYLHHLHDAQKDPTVFIQLSGDFADSAIEETQRLFEHTIFDRDSDLRDVLTTRDTFLDRTLARIYDVRAPAREGFGLTTLPEDGPRAGILGHASLLAVHAHPTSSSATLRGKFVRQTLLCEVIPPPPANVDTSIPEPSADAPTLRDRIAVHLENPSCAGCHRSMDPIGLGLENFDGLGGHRLTEADTRIDASGDLDGAAFEDAIGLAKQIRAHDHFVPCMVDQIARYALGRHIADGETEAFAWLVEQFEMNDHRVQPLWRELILNPIFRRVGASE